MASHHSTQTSSVVCTARKSCTECNVRRGVTAQPAGSRPHEGHCSTRDANTRTAHRAGLLMMIIAPNQPKRNSAAHNKSSESPVYCDGVVPVDPH